MKKIIFSLAVAAVCGMLKAQDGEEPTWGIKFSGFVNTDYFFDSRQTVNAREGHFLLWPAAENFDPNNEDINAKASFNMLSIRTRIRGTISGPDVMGAKSSAVIEGSFFGHSNADVNGFRLRHAFAKLNWENTEVIIGQYWHPLFIPACFPATLSFNTGAPFQPFARNPQIRLTHELGSIKISVTALSHADFYSAAGVSGLRNSGIPELHFHYWYNRNPSENEIGILLGGGAGYKRLIPSLETAMGYKTTQGLGSFMSEYYVKLILPEFTVKAEGTYGQNNYDVVMISSFAVKSIDPLTGRLTYTPTSSYSAWAEIISNNPTWQPAVFAGYTKNLGARKDILAGSIAGTRGNIDFVYRVSPRLLYNVGKMRFGVELEYTVAAFGNVNSTGKIDNATAVGNFRTLLSAFYFF